MTVKRGRIYVLSAPAGTGKTTLIERLAHEYDHIEKSISYTTRSPRGDEKDGVDYHFVSNQTFERMVKEKFFLDQAI